MADYTQIQEALKRCRYSAVTRSNIGDFERASQNFFSSVDEIIHSLT